MVQPVVIPDGPQSEEKIAVAVRGLHTGRLFGPSGMRVEHLKACFLEATQERDPTTTRWDALISTTQLEIREGRLQGGYRGIGLTEVICKIIATIINTQLRVSISLHNALHGFQQGRGTSTATLEANFSQQLAVI